MAGASVETFDRRSALLFALILISVISVMCVTVSILLTKSPMKEQGIILLHLYLKCVDFKI